MKHLITKEKESFVFPWIYSLGPQRLDWHKFCEKLLIHIDCVEYTYVARLKTGLLDELNY